MNETSDKKQSRKHKRYETPGLIDFVIDDESDYHYGFLINLSREGLYVESSRVFEVGSIHKIRFVLPVLDWVFETHAKVQWTKTCSPEEKMTGLDDGLGLFFAEIDAKDVEQLDVFFDMHERGETEITDFSSHRSSYRD